MRVLWFPQVGADCIGTVGEHQDVEESGDWRPEAKTQCPTPIHTRNDETRQMRWLTTRKNYENRAPHARITTLLSASCPDSRS